MSILEAGYVEVLQVKDKTDFGYFLTNGKEDVFLPNSEVNENFDIEENKEVFLYKDKKGRLTSTLKIPEVQVGKYGWSEVVSVNHKLGAFVNIGIAKDILVTIDDLPNYFQTWPEKGDKLYITLELGKNGDLFGRIATESVIEVLTTPAPEDMHNQNISGRIYRVLKVGSFMLSDLGYRCFIHESERTNPEPRLGEQVNGRVIEVKEDGSLNVSLLPRKQELIGTDSDIILDYLESHDGSMPYGDKSSPEEIAETFNMSKSAFKRALGNLMKENKIGQQNGNTFLK